MVWGAISYYGTCELQFISAKKNAITYKGVTEKAFQHFDNIFRPIPWTFQHDNAPIHTARAVKHLNIIENVWGCYPAKYMRADDSLRILQP